MTTDLKPYWRCLKCPESGNGDMAAVQRAAERHTKAGHPTVAGMARDR